MALDPEMKSQAGSPVCFHVIPLLHQLAALLNHHGGLPEPHQIPVRKSVSRMQSYSFA